MLWAVIDSPDKCVDNSGGALAQTVRKMERNVSTFASEQSLEVKDRKRREVQWRRYGQRLLLLYPTAEAWLTSARFKWN